MTGKKSIVYLCCFSTFLTACGGGVPVVAEKRVTNPSDCARVDPDAQDLFLNWAKGRRAEGRPVAPSRVAALMHISLYETAGGGKTPSPANITGHGSKRGGDFSRHSMANKAGWGQNRKSVKQPTSIVENTLDKYKFSGEANYGAVQMSPNKIASTPGRTNLFVNFINSASSVSDLYDKCLTGLAYKDQASAMQKLNDLYSKRANFRNYVRNISGPKYNAGTARSRRNCSNDPTCNQAAEYLGRWLAYCPKLNLDLSENVYNSNKSYWGVLDQTGRNPGICKDMIAQELSSDPSKHMVENPRVHGDAQAI